MPLHMISVRHLTFQDFVGFFTLVAKGNCLGDIKLRCYDQNCGLG